MMKAFMGVVLVASVLVGGCADTKMFEKRLDALEAALANKDAQVMKLQRQEETLQQGGAAKLDELTTANRDLTLRLEEEIKKGDVTIDQLKDSLRVSVVQEVLFDSGHSELRPEGKQMLEKVAGVLKGVNNRLILAEGHTDNVPIGPALVAKYPSNWELSTARATTVVRFLKEMGVDPKHLGAAGFAEYHPVAPNTDAQGRQKNRRMDILLEPEVGPIGQPTTNCVSSR